VYKGLLARLDAHVQRSASGPRTAGCRFLHLFRGNRSVQYADHLTVIQDGSRNMHAGYLSGGIRADLAGAPRLSL